VYVGGGGRRRERTYLLAGPQQKGPRTECLKEHLEQALRQADDSLRDFIHSSIASKNNFQPLTVPPPLTLRQRSSWPLLASSLTGPFLGWVGAGVLRGDRQASAHAASRGDPIPKCPLIRSLRPSCAHPGPPEGGDTSLPPKQPLVSTTKPTRTSALTRSRTLVSSSIIVIIIIRWRSVWGPSCDTSSGTFARNQPSSRSRLPASRYELARPVVHCGAPR
jgi:hypothetical protein